MKRIPFIVLALLMAHFVAAQAPQALNYQGIARNTSGTPLANQALSLRLSILSGNANGSVVYAETHNTQTNALGLYVLQIGTGAVINGNFGLIGWGLNQHFLSVEIDATGGNNFTPIGAPALLASVPYALEARHAASTTVGGDVTGVSTANTVTRLQNRPINNVNPATGDVLKWNGAAWSPANDLTGGGGFNLPYEGTASDPNAVFQVNANGAGAAILGVALGSNSAVQAFNNANGTAAQFAGPGYSAYFNDRVLIETSNPGPELRVYDGGGSGAELQLDNGAHSFNFVASDNYLFLNDNSGQRLSIVDGGDISFATEYMSIADPNGGNGQISFNVSNYPTLNVRSASGNGGGIRGYDPGLGLLSDGITVAYLDQEGYMPFESMQYNLGRYNYHWNTVYAVSLSLSSDRRLKEQIKPIKYGLNTVMQMRPVDYFWKDKAVGKTQQLGFIAQELEEIMPEAVSHQQMTPSELEQCKKNGQAIPEITDPYSINYVALIPVLVKAIQEQQTVIQQLQQRIETIENN